MKTICYRTKSIETARATVPQLPEGYEWLPPGPGHPNPWYHLGGSGFAADAVADKDNPELVDSIIITL